MELDRYQLIRTIASGGMGQVYEGLARGHDGFERRVAIKRLLPELLGDDRARRAFREEARIASQLHHGTIVQVLDYGVVDGAEFLVFEFVDGIDASRVGSMPERLAIHVVAEIAHALAYAHAAGIVHRDVSAQNILLSWAGDVKLSDFGIALARAKDHRTTTGVVKGKLGYLAPELFDGARATPAADVYALGVTLRVLVTGDPSDHTVDDAQVADLVARCTVDAPAARPSADELGTIARGLAGSTGRVELCAFLAGHRRATPTSALDDLMGMALVRSEHGAYTVERTAATLAERPRRRRIVPVAIGAVVATAATVATIAWTQRDRVTVAPVAVARDAAPVVVERTDAQLDAPAIVVDAAPIADAAPAIHHHLARDAGVPADATATATATVPVRGWLGVGGRELVNLAVEVDNARVGLAPFLGEVAVGRHHIVVRDAGGAPLVDTVVDVGERNTRAEPARVTK